MSFIQVAIICLNASKDFETIKNKLIELDKPESKFVFVGTIEENISLLEIQKVLTIISNSLSTSNM